MKFLFGGRISVQARGHDQARDQAGAGSALPGILDGTDGVGLTLFLTLTTDPDSDSDSIPTLTLGVCLTPITSSGASP